MLKPFIPRYLILILSLVFGLAVAVVSILPVNRLALGTRTASHDPAAIQRAARVHAVVHIGVFGAIACAAWITAGHFAHSAAVAALNRMIALVLTMLLGCGTEYLQHRVYRNSLELNDVFINLSSTLAVFGLLALRDRYRSQNAVAALEGEQVS